MTNFLTIPPAAQARVIAVSGKRCRLALRDGFETEAVIRGTLLKESEGALAVGDFVKAERFGEDWRAEELLPRENEFVREGLRKDRQVMFANVDRVLILASLSHPQTKTASIDRFLVAALRGGIPVELAITKTDLDPGRKREQEIQELYEAFQLPIHPVCNNSGKGTAELGERLQVGVTALVGNSGVGKTSLLNRLIPGLDLRVREVSSWSGKGTHTTTTAIYVPYGELGAIVDTPGMKSFVPYGISRENLAPLFPDIAAAAPGCRFRNCLHVSEPGCAVKIAVETGELSTQRFRSYLRLLEETPK